MLLNGKVAMVTGAGRGIGKAIALRFAEEGARLVLCARSAGQLDAVADTVRALGRSCHSGTLDVADEAQVALFVHAALQSFGRIDILVNNAGVSNPKPFLETSDADWDEAIGVNFKGVVFCTRAVLPGMLHRGNGRIINIASAAAVRGLPGSPAYTASKFAVVGLTQSLADEVMEKGVRVNVLCPGPVKTELFDSSPLKDFLLKNPANLHEMDDMTGAALYLASDLSGGMNSQTLVIRKTSRW